MNEFKYNICEDGIKKLVKVRFNNDQEIKKSFLKIAIVSVILIEILIIPMTIILKYNFKTSMIFIIGSILFYAMLFPGLKWVRYKMTMEEYLKKIRPYINKEIYMKFDNKNIEIDKYGAKSIYILKKCDILLIDEERIYIKFSDNSMIYVPKDVFKDNDEFNTFIMLLKK